MTGDRPMLDTRRAVRQALREAGTDPRTSGAEPRTPDPEPGTPGAAGPLVLVALSGGADSLALAAALATEAPRQGIRAGAVVVDHGLQAGSAEIAAAAAAAARGLGLDPVLVRRVRVDAGVPAGPEAAARAARYDAFVAAAAETGARALLTGHTRSDQAEQVLLGLTRGSGIRSLAGIPRQRALTPTCAVIRPFLAAAPEITRATTVAACALQGLSPWEDPHNADPSYARVRARERVLPVLEAELGPGAAAALARTADLAAEDAAALDELAAAAAQRARVARDDAPNRGATALSVAVLRELPAALRHRVIRQVAAADFGAHLGRSHTTTVAALITDWRGQGPISAPGIRVSRERDVLAFRPLDPGE